MIAYQSDAPKKNESQPKFALRLEAEGQREIYIRKALREHFGLSIEDTILICSKLSDARHKELLKLRERFPNLNENRFAWRISKSLTISKEDAMTWSQTILATEGNA